MSILSSTYSSQLSGVAGLKTRPGFAAAFADQPDRAVDVLARLGMERDVGGACLREIRHDAVDGFDHQVHVDGRRDARLAQCLTHQRADREIRHVVVVHHVEMDDVRARRQHGPHFLAEPREIGGQDRRCDPGCLRAGVLGHRCSDTLCGARYCPACCYFIPR
jgi:hypothetical protein